MSELLDMDPTFACDVIYSLLEAIPGQTEDRDWWPDELTRAVAAAKAYVKQTCVCDPNVNYFDGECIAPGRAYRARIAELEALTRWRPIAEAPKDGQEFWLHGEFTYMPYREVGPTQVLGKWSAGWGAWITNGGQYFTATHYMPAPPAPEPPKEAS